MSWTRFPGRIRAAAEKVFGAWEAPADLKIELFVVRVGEWGGHMLVDCEDPLTVHKLCSTFAAFEFTARPVVAVEDAVRVELEAIEWRDGLQLLVRCPSREM